MVKPVDPAQGSFNFGENPEKPEKRKVGPSAFDEELAKQKEDRQDKAKSKTAENEEFKDKRQPKSELIRQAEIERMKEILNKPKPKVASGVGSSAYSGADLERGMMGSRMPKPKLKAGGKVSSASKRADGCCVKGKTKGRMV
jgi:hypothetical protein